MLQVQAHKYKQALVSLTAWEKEEAAKAAEAAEAAEAARKLEQAARDEREAAEREAAEREAAEERRAEEQVVRHQSQQRALLLAVAAGTALAILVLRRRK